MTDRFAGYGRPRAVEGGIRARSRRGAIGQSWWSGRFLAVLESLGMGGRLARGRSYARKGQVTELEVGTGAITASVQGSRARPYRVRIGVPAFGKGQWAQVEQALADDAWYAATLLAGEMPDDIEGVFAGGGLSLFPAGRADLAMDCSCPDWEEPCKHLAAVFYLVAEAFDADPFAMLAWRGRDRDELLGNVRARRGGPPAATVRSFSANRLRPGGGLSTYPRTAPYQVKWVILGNSSRSSLEHVALADGALRRASLPGG